MRQRKRKVSSIVCFFLFRRISDFISLQLTMITFFLLCSTSKLVSIYIVCFFVSLLFLQRFLSLLFRSKYFILYERSEFVIFHFKISFDSHSSKQNYPSGVTSLAFQTRYARTFSNCFTIEAIRVKCYNI